MRTARLVALSLAAATIAAACGPAAPATSTATAPADPTPSRVACTLAETPPVAPWADRVWYEVFVRSFADSDGDGVGDLRGLTERLDYLNDGDPATTDDLGVGGLWLMPIAEAASYHGYDVTDYEAVEPDYGTLADLRALLDAAHERGMRVIVDLVPNHTSSGHPWFRDAVAGGPHEDWYLWSDERPEWGGPDGRTVWHEAGGRWYYGVFDDGMPDLDLTNPAVTAELEGIARYWLADVGVDGFRIDAAKHLIETAPDAQTNTPETKAWLAGFKGSVDAVRPDALLVGEVWEIAAIAGRYVPDSLDLTFDFGLATGIRLALENGRGGPLRTALGDHLRWWPPNRAATFLSNHDQERIMSALRGDTHEAALAAFLLLTAPGVPFLYYGEEIGLEGRKPDERIRTPMPWTGAAPGAGFTSGTPWEPLAETAPGTNVAAQAVDPTSLLSTYRSLIRTRLAEAPLRDGGTILLETGDESLVAWLRTTATGTQLVLANLADAPVTDYSLALADGPLCGAVVTRLVASVGFPSAADASAPEPPAVGARGGFDAYRPLATIPARSGLVVALEPAR